MRSAIIHISQQMVAFIRRYTHGVDWRLLLLLVLVLNVKLFVKVLAIALFTWMYRGSLFQKNNNRPIYTWFYVCMIVITLVNCLLNIPSLSLNYFFVALAGAGIWVLCGLVALLLIQFVQKNTIETLHATVSLFFIINALIGIGQLLFISLDTEHLNPYTYQGLQQKYFISTGDFITGISFDVATTNALINAMAIIYFLVRNRMASVLLCMAALLLSVSNFTNIVLLILFIYLFTFRSTRNQKSIIVVCLFMLVIFMVKISPQNNRYVKEVYARITGTKKAATEAPKQETPLKDRPDSLLSGEEKKQKKALFYLDSMALASLISGDNALYSPLTNQGIAHTRMRSKPSLPREDIHSAPFQCLKDTTPVQKTLLAFASFSMTSFDTVLSHTKSRTLPGKLMAYKQTFSFLAQRPRYLLTGTGTGNFSSKLAFRATGLQIAGGYPKRFVYISNHFLDNHLGLYLDYFSKDAELHSLTNSPDSVYDQLLSEYGLLGLLAFFFFYVRYFLKGATRNAATIPIIGIMAAAFCMGYWYEQLSIVIIFELLLLINKKETANLSST